MITIEIRGSKQLQAKLKRLENPSKAIDRGMRDYITDIKKEIIEYPPESAANIPPGPNGYSWYKRRYGTVTITGLKWKTSQDMLNRWSFKTAAQASKVRATITNNASYASFVVGDRQVGFHKRRGWKVAFETIDRTKGDALKLIEKQIDRELSK